LLLVEVLHRGKVFKNEGYRKYFTPFMDWEKGERRGHSKIILENLSMSFVVRKRGSLEIREMELKNG
jgi:hypothetical protein